MVSIRRVRQQDCLLLWEWANDPEVRRQAFDHRPIPMDSHVEWFNHKLADPNCYLYIMETDDHLAVGQVRLDVQEDKTAVLDFSVRADVRGHGYGSAALKTASRLLFKECLAARVVGLVKPDNRASLWAFEKAGFHQDGQETVDGQVALRLTLTRDEIEIGQP